MTFDQATLAAMYQGMLCRAAADSKYAEELAELGAASLLLRELVDFSVVVLSQLPDETQQLGGSGLTARVVQTPNGFELRTSRR